jgi:nicotinamide-nucleotide amidase
MQASIITIGDELLIGQVVDTNSSFIGKHLNDLGFYIKEKRVIADLESEIITAIEQISEHSDICIVTGGLGPTKDDITKETICKIWEDDLVEKADLIDYLQNWYSKRGLEFTTARREQALVPSSCSYFVNPVGSAPCMYLKKNDCLFFFLPGVPTELYAFMDKYLVPYLKDISHQQKVEHRYLTTHGMPESEIASLLEDVEDGLSKDISLAYLPNFRLVRLRLTAVYENPEILKELDKNFDILKERLKHISLYEGDLSVEEALHKELLKRNLTISTAESCTGGRIASALTSLSGSSKYFIGSVLSYDNRIKTDILQVNPKDIANFGAVSQPVVEQMAQNVAHLYKTDIALSTSGIAGPTGGSDEKPVGTTWFGIWFENKIFSYKVRFRSNRKRNLEQATKESIILLLSLFKQKDEQ